IEVAIENMRKSGAAKAAKKAGRVAAEGVILVKENEGKAAIVEINCETDFVAKDANFAAFANQVAETALAEGLEIDALKEKFEQQRAELVAKIG
ncbi:translation elongation factor Ts, partial [Enterococcus faecalis]